MLFAGEEPTNEQSYRYLTNDGDFKLQDDSHDMDPTTEKKNSTMSRAGDESAYGADTLERTMIRYVGKINFISRNLNQNIVTIGLSRRTEWTAAGTWTTLTT